MRANRIVGWGVAVLAACAAGAVFHTGRSAAPGAQLVNAGSPPITVARATPSSGGWRDEDRTFHQSARQEVAPRTAIEKDSAEQDAQPGVLNAQPEVLASLPHGALRIGESMPHADAVLQRHPRGLLMEKDSGGTSDEAVLHVVRQWASKDPERSGAWAQQIGSESLRQRALVAVATLWADRDPRAAALFAIEAIPPGRRQSDAVAGIVQRWAQQDAPVAAAWVEAFPPGDMQHAAAMNLVQQWAQQDAAAAAAWMNGLPASGLRDRAVEEFIRHLAPRDATSAELWANTLSTTQACMQAHAWLEEQRRADHAALLAGAP